MCDKILFRDAIHKLNNVKCLNACESLSISKLEKARIKSPRLADKKLLLNVSTHFLSEKYEEVLERDSVCWLFSEVNIITSSK